jgi:CheY-like chemotaxis protein
MKIRDVYYVDDDKDDLSIFKETVNSLGITPHLYHPTESILFVDLNMPKINGLDLIKAVRKSDMFKSLPIIIFSTAKNPQSIEKCLNIGASMYLSKPTSLAGYQKAIIHVLSINWETHVVSADNFFYE